MINVFVIGARGYMKMYGGWTALIHGIVENQSNFNIKYYVYEVVKSKDDEGIIEIDNIFCIKRYFNDSKASAMIKSDASNAFHSVRYIKKNNIENPIILFLGLRIGPLAYLIRLYIKSCNAIIMENAAGVEWKRPKWGKVAQLYMRISAYFMARASDYLICDAEAILEIYDKMIKFKRPKKVFIAYGSNPSKHLNPVFPKKVKEYFDKYKIVPGEYYVIINRFVPENSYELILSDFIKSDTTKDLILVTNNDKEHVFYDVLSKMIHFEKDKRIKFVGTMYDKEIVDYLRQNAYAYINGHTLGGSNPGLIEAMASTGIVLAYDVIFSHEVCGDFALYYGKDFSLNEMIEICEKMNIKERELMSKEAKKRMNEKYNWKNITCKYETLFEMAIEKNKEKI